MQKLYLKPGKEHSLNRYHPWVFSGALAENSAPISNGDPVAIYTSEGNLIASGHFHSGSIAVKILTFSNIELNDSFWHNKIENAVKLRHATGVSSRSDTNVYRLINGEGDGLPGLIVDFYNGTVVIQAHTMGMHKVRNSVCQILRDLLGGALKSVYYKGMKSVNPGNRDNLTEYLYGEASDGIVMENGNLFKVDWESGQKTGFFIDQRDNRQLLGNLSANRTILNMFGYSGGFSVYALKGGATRVVTVDSSSQAINLAEENVSLNFVGESQHSAICADVYDYFKNNSEKFDVVVIDPPAYAKNLKSRNNALQAYKRLNIKAIERVKSGGMLFTFSCSQVVDTEQFRQAVYSASIETGRMIRVVNELSQPADHPVSIFHPEGRYLKGLVLYVD